MSRFTSNKELLKEIDLSKRSYCWFKSPAHADYAAIVHSPDEITPDLIAQHGKDAVFRVMTSDHIPPLDESEKVGRAKTRTHARTNFPPFKHYQRAANGRLVEVGRSHWKGSPSRGKFSTEHGKPTARLASQWMKMVENYGRRGNWRGYSYREEMEADALCQLCKVGLQFDESKSQNPFAFYTTTMAHCFTRALNLEKKQQVIRDDLLFAAGGEVSHTRMTDWDMHRMGLSEPKQLPAKRGRPKGFKAAA